MTVKFNVPGKKRKELAQEIGRWLSCQIEYLGAPTFAYQVGDNHIDREGNLTISEKHDSEVVERLLQHLYDANFDYDISAEPSETAETESRGLCVSMPRSMVDDHAVANLEALVKAKGNLFKKAFGVDTLPIEVTDDKVSFPWFTCEWSPEEVNAYDTFICKLCEMAKNQRQITAKEKAVDNEKYAFRCFLLRLGFIGEEYKASRKILLKNLSGSSAFREVG